MQIRTDLLAAAERLLAEKGLDRTTINDITSEAGVGFGTFYNYFASKEEVFKELVLSGLNLLVERINDRCHQTADHRERLRIVAEETADFAIGHRDLFLLLFTTSSDVYEAVRQGVSGFARCLESLLREGFTDAAYQPLDPVLAARALIGIFAFVLRPLARGDVKDDDVRSSLVGLVQGAVIGASNSKPVGDR
jgi:AcrR family transcriptional regulator